MRLVTILSSLSKFHLSSPLLLFCLLLWDYPKLWQCNSSFLLLLLILSPAVLFNPINDHVFSCQSSSFHLLVSSLTQHRGFSPLPCPCFYVLYDRLQKISLLRLTLPSSSSACAFSDETWINQTWQSVKILPSSILCIDFFLHLWTLSPSPPSTLLFSLSFAITSTELGLYQNMTRCESPHTHHTHATSCQHILPQVSSRQEVRNRSQTRKDPGFNPLFYLIYSYTS